MNIIERIKNFWNNRKQKALPQAQESQMMHNQNMAIKPKRAWMLPKEEYNQPTKLEKEIDDFLHAYSSRIESIDPTYPLDSYQTAYSALVRMKGKPVTTDEYNNNSYKEQALLDQLSINKKYTVSSQGKKDSPDFYHIKSSRYRMPKADDMIRVYINCNNGNIAELSNLILGYNTNPNFYMKFTSNNANARGPRGEKIVIYCASDEINYVMQLINHTKSIRPDLYKESENVLPFLQNIDNAVSVAEQPITDQFVDLYGRRKTIDQSANAFLATALKDSYIETAREIARCDPNLAFLLQKEHINDEILYVRNYPYINQNYHDYLLKSTEAKLVALSAKNHLSIDGIDHQMVQNNDRNQQQRNQQEVTK